jgi:hypothetical protein
MPAKKVVPYEELNYNKKKQIYDSLVQCIQDVKYGEVHTNNKWNIPVERMSSITSRLVGEGYLELTAHHYEVTTPEQLAHSVEFDKDIIKEFVKELKKSFRKLTSKTLELKEVKVDRTIEKVSGLRADRSWTNDSPIGRYLVRDTMCFEFDHELLK